VSLVELNNNPSAVGAFLYNIDDIPTVAVPEPATFGTALVALAVAGLARAVSSRSWKWAARSARS
jgi:hypothetical protein